MRKIGKTSKWVQKLIDKITLCESPNNNYFMYYGYEINQCSGTVDFTDVSIRKDGKHIASFSFDFWTKELVLEFYESDKLRNGIVLGFASIYSSVCVNDVTLDERRKVWEEIVNNSDEYVNSYVEKAKKELEKIDNLPEGEVDLNDWELS